MWARGAWKRLEGLVSLWHPVLRCDPFLTHMLPPWGDAANSALAREKPVPVWWPGASGLHEISLPWGIYCSNKDQTGAIAKATEGISQLTWRRYSFSTNGDYIQDNAYESQVVYQTYLKMGQKYRCKTKTCTPGKKFKPHVLLTFIWAMVSYFENMILVHTHKMNKLGTTKMFNSNFKEYYQETKRTNHRFGEKLCKSFFWRDLSLEHTKTVPTE